MARRRGIYGSKGWPPTRAPDGPRGTACGSFLQGARWASERLRGFRPEDGGVGRERRHPPGTPSTGVSTVSPPCGRTAEGWCLFHAWDSPGPHRGLRTHTHPPAPRASLRLRDCVAAPCFSGCMVHASHLQKLPSADGVYLVCTFASHGAQRSGVVLGKLVAGSPAAHPRPPR